MDRTFAQDMGKYLDSLAPWDVYGHITYRPWPRRYVNPRGFVSQVLDTPSPIRARRLFGEFVVFLELRINSRVG